MDWRLVSKKHFAVRTGRCWVVCHAQGLQEQRAFGTLTWFCRDILLNVKRAVSAQLTTKNTENLCGSELLRREYLEWFVSHVFPKPSDIYQRIQWNSINPEALLMMCGFFAFLPHHSSNMLMQLIYYSREAGAVVGERVLLKTSSRRKVYFL